MVSGVSRVGSVRVLVMDWTTMGWSEPTITPPTSTATVFLREIMSGNLFHL